MVTYIVHARSERGRGRGVFGSDWSVKTQCALFFPGIVRVRRSFFFLLRLWPCMVAITTSSPRSTPTSPSVHRPPSLPNFKQQRVVGDIYSTFHALLGGDKLVRYTVFGRISISVCLSPPPSPPPPRALLPSSQLVPARPLSLQPKPRTQLSSPVVYVVHARSERGGGCGVVRDVGVPRDLRCGDR